MKQVIDSSKQQERISRRQALGPLKRLTVQPKTRKRYDDALIQLRQYLRMRQLRLPRKIGEMDVLLSDYIEHLWGQGFSKGQASDTLAAVQDAQPSLRHNLALSWRLMRTWNLREIPCRAPPFPEHLIQALTGYFLFLEDDSIALSLLLGFYGVLRTGEILSLKAEDFTLSADAMSAVISLRNTKTGRRTGHAESVTLRVYDVCSRLHAWLQTHRGKSLIDVSPETWRRRFKTALSALDLGSLQFQPYSLRRGGATFWFNKSHSLDQVCVLGRWQSMSTARIYLNEAVALLGEIKMPHTHPSVLPFWQQYQRRKFSPQLERASQMQVRGTRKRARNC